MKKIVITGVAGFIGYHLTKKLLAAGNIVIGIDNLSPYYDVRLKEARLEELRTYPGFTFYLNDICDIDVLVKDFPDVTHVVHLAAQAGVRYCAEKPFEYVHSNLKGQVHVLEACRQWKSLQHFIYASSSSVYGGNLKQPFSVQDPVDKPLSLYAATKRSAELMGYAYWHGFGIPCTGLRFFTVYGPWGRPDMAIFQFLKAMKEGKELTVYNGGDMWRSFTYIDDVIDGVMACIDLNPDQHYRLFNLGGATCHSVCEVIDLLEELTGLQAKKHFKPYLVMDVPRTVADLTESFDQLGFMPKVSLKEGLGRFVSWYHTFYG